MDLQDFMPRYPTSQSNRPSDHTFEPIVEPTSRPKKKSLPRHTLPPPPLWEAPPPAIPPRNPLRLAKIQARPHTHSQSKDHHEGEIDNGQPTGNFTSKDSANSRTVNDTPMQAADTIAFNSSNEKPTIRQVIPSDNTDHQLKEEYPSPTTERSNPTTNTPQRQNRSFLTNYQLPTARLILPSIDQRLDFSRTLHEEIEHLRKSYIDEADDVFFTFESAKARVRETPEPITPLRRSASARTPIRNFSLPSYGSPVKQATPARPLRRVRSRSLGVGEGKREWQGVPPMKNEKFPVAKLAGLPEMTVEGSPNAAMHEAIAVSTKVLPSVSARSEAAVETVIATEKNKDVESQKSELVKAAAAELQSGAQSYSNPANAFQISKEASREEKGNNIEEACLKCGSIRRALARNPLCCIYRPNMKRACFKCWNEALAASLTKKNQDEWLCCAACGRELVMSDVKRLAGRSTVLRFKIRCAASNIRGSLVIGSGKVGRE